MSTLPLITAPDIENDRELYVFRKAVKGFPQSGNTVLFSEERISGRLILFSTPDELNIRVWDFTLRTAAKICNSSRENISENAASLIFVLQPHACRLTRIGAHSQFYRAEDPFQLTISRFMPLELRVDAHEAIRVVEMHVSARFFEKSPEDSFQKLNATLFDNRSFIEFRLCTPHTLSRLEKLADIMRTDHATAAQIRPLCFDCITETFSSMPVSLEPRQHSAYDGKMEMLEELIDSSICGSLPPLTTIARQANMSLSTMKRHFKARYGLNIYEYYLTRKMEYAKKLLQEQQVSVNTIAQMLNYESVSNFIETFKKHHGFSPGRIKKQ